MPPWVCLEAIDDFLVSNYYLFWNLESPWLWFFYRCAVSDSWTVRPPFNVLFEIFWDKPLPTSLLLALCWTGIVWPASFDPFLLRWELFLTLLAGKDWNIIAWPRPFFYCSSCKNLSSYYSPSFRSSLSSFIKSNTFDSNISTMRAGLTSVYWR